MAWWIRGRINFQFDRRLACSGSVACMDEQSVLYSAMANSYPTIIPGLRSPSEQIKGLVYFSRMLDKIRLAAQDKLPGAWREMRGATKPGSFDARCCRFLGIDYAALEKE